jgi:hypothetical protein
VLISTADSCLTVSTEKRVAALKAEVDFFGLLREHSLTTPDILWKDVIALPTITDGLCYLYQVL